MPHPAPGNPPEFMELIGAIAAGESDRARRLLVAYPALARQKAAVGASRQTANEYFFPALGHYLYAGDTALHMAAAAYAAALAASLLGAGANVAAKNRRGAEPLHYASDWRADAPEAQAATIDVLLRAGACPGTLDRSGVAPLHRAVRTRSIAAVRALLAGGASVRQKNESGSTPLHLAVQNTGRSGSGEPQAVERQRQIIVLLRESGAVLGETDGQGRTAAQAASTEWARALLAGGGATEQGR